MLTAEVVLIKSRNVMELFSSILIELMPYHFYILYSKKLNRFYVGHTSNLENRLFEHNNSESPYTSQGLPWTLLWSTTKDYYRQAEALEFKLKNLSRARKIKFMRKYSDGIQELESSEILKS